MCGDGSPMPRADAVTARFIHGGAGGCAAAPAAAAQTANATAAASALRAECRLDRAERLLLTGCDALLRLGDRLGDVLDEAAVRADLVGRLLLEQLQGAADRVRRLLLQLVGRRPHAEPRALRGRAEVAHERARALPPGGEVLRHRRRLAERVEETAVAHGDEQPGARDALLQRLPFLIREIGLT